MSLVKEITKINEKVIVGNAKDIIAWLSESSWHIKGEFALVVEGWQEQLSNAEELDFIPSELSQRCVVALREHFPLKMATKITEKITFESSKSLYRFFTSDTSN